MDHGGRDGLLLLLPANWIWFLVSIGGAVGASIAGRTLHCGLSLGPKQRMTRRDGGCDVEEE